jgi:hypothetical protein
MVLATIIIIMLYVLVGQLIQQVVNVIVELLPILVLVIQEVKLYVQLEKVVLVIKYVHVIL